MKFHYIVSCSEYSAPEINFGGSITSRKVDIYSLGVIIIELVTGSKKKPSIANVSVICLVLSCDPFLLNHANIFCACFCTFYSEYMNQLSIRKVSTNPYNSWARTWQFFVNKVSLATIVMVIPITPPPPVELKPVAIDFTAGS